MTESILTTLDPSAILDQVSDQLAELVGYDNISIEIVDPDARAAETADRRGVHADEYLEPWSPGEEGLATWVVAGQRAGDRRRRAADARVNQFRDGRSTAA